MTRHERNKWSEEEQIQWMIAEGGTLEGYIEKYGTAAEPKGQGDGGPAIFNADLIELQRKINRVDYYEGYCGSGNRRHADEVLSAALPKVEPVDDEKILADELQSLMRCFDRDDILEHREDRVIGSGVRVFVLRSTAVRIRNVLRRVKDKNRG